TGVAERDVTPEATRAVCDRLVDGIAERMRAEGAKKTPLAALSRGLCGTRGRSLVLNLPGSPGGATESLAAVIDLLPHALELLRGKTAHAKSRS
ncbi:MAG TPA: molybdopterin-binding protein, partial [Terriglobales bacterium]|nr:molybdopterin-binding protein [Terriglobales bacterium]